MSAFSGFSPDALKFLRGLKRKNEKPWFEEHRAAYEHTVKNPLRQLAEELDIRFATLAPEFVAPPKRALFRIHRDVRFSKDKSPYKTHAALWVFHRDAGRGVGRSIGEAHGGAGFYFHLEPGASLVAGRQIANRAPRPTALSTLMCPSLCVTTPCTIARPSPVPRVRSFVVKNGSNRCGWRPAAIPTPVSVTDSST